MTDTERLSFENSILKKDQIIAQERTRTKILENALRYLLQTIKSYSCHYRVNDEARIAAQVLAAYDSHPADALSRAPQPDTVTEERIEAAARAIFLHDHPPPKKSWDEIGHGFHHDNYRARARAALAARGE